MIEEKGPWAVVFGNGNTYIESDDFTHDAHLYVRGDFESAEQKVAYAEEIARRLNTFADWEVVSNVDTAIYILFDPDGKMRRCGETLDIATNYLVEGMGAGLWNALFGEPAKTRVKVFELHGWKVQQGTFTPPTF